MNTKSDAVAVVLGPWRPVMLALLEKFLAVAQEHNDRSCDFDVCKEYRDAQAMLTAAPSPPAALGGVEARVVCDWSDPGGTGVIFVEVENAAGASINVGPWHDRPDGLKELRLYTHPVAARVEVGEEMVERAVAEHDGWQETRTSRAAMRAALRAALSSPQGDGAMAGEGKP